MLEKIHRLADEQQALGETRAESTAAIEAGMPMSEEEAANLLQTRTLHTAVELKANAKEIDIADALKGVQTAINRLQGFEQAQMDVAPFLWTPKPTAMKSHMAAHKGSAWSTETYGVAGWNIYWRNCSLGRTSLLLSKNGDEFSEGALQAAVIPSDLPLSGRKGEPLVDIMLQEGSENVRRIALGGILAYAEPVYGQMAALVEQVRQGYRRTQPEDKFIGSHESGALYYAGAIILDTNLNLDQAQQLHALTMLYDGKYQQLAEDLGIEEWPVDNAALARFYKTEKYRKRSVALFTAPYMATSHQGEVYMRMYGHLKKVYETGRLLGKEVFSAEGYDPAASQFSGQPWLYRSQENSDALQAAFALPPQEVRRRLVLGRRAVGGAVGSRSVPISADNRLLALNAHRQIQDMVSAAYIDQLEASSKP
jgi:hypothetical protein